MYKMNQKPIMIIKTGETFPLIKKTYDDFEFWIQEKTIDCSYPLPFRVIDAYKNEALPLIEQCGGVIVTGSHAMSTDNADWSELIVDWIPHVVKKKIPFLGICYGHHLLAKAFGGTIGKLPCGIELGTVRINTTQAAQDDPLFYGVPEVFNAQLAHYQTIVDLPENATGLAASFSDKYQAIRIGGSAWGVQFHPEFSPEIISAYIDNQRLHLYKFGVNWRRIKETISNSEMASKILVNFGEVVLTHS